MGIDIQGLKVGLKAVYIGCTKKPFFNFVYRISLCVVGTKVK